VSPPDVLIVDAPWKFSDKLPGKTRGAERHYACMTVDELCAFPLPDLSPNTVMFFWRVASMQDEALAVVQAWGFKVKSELVWLKQTVNGKSHFGLGRYVRASHETCLIATRGKAMPVVRNVRSVLDEPLAFEAPTGVHSQKPDRFFELVEAMNSGEPMTGRRRRSRNAAGSGIQYSSYLP